MSNPGDQTRSPRTRELNLNTMAEQFAAGIQRHFDMLAFNLASRDCLTGEAYNKRVQSPRMMPATALHNNFEQMRAYASDLLVRQLVTDVLNLAVHCLNNVHLFLALVKARHEHGELSPAAQQEAQQAHTEFLRMPLDQKFNRLEERFGIMCDLEDTLISLGFALQALTQQQSQVGKPQLDENGELTLELQVAKAGVTGGDAWKQPEDLDTSPKVFREGERISLSDIDLQNLLLTVGVFGRKLFSSVSRYIRDNNGRS